MVLKCLDYYKINNATTGVVLTDAAFLTALSGKAVDVDGKGTYPPIYAGLGVEALAAGAATAPGGYLTLTSSGVQGLDPVWDQWNLPIPFYSLRTTEIDQPYNMFEPFDRYILNMPYPQGSTLCDGTYSKLFGSAANTYSAFVLYQMYGQLAPPPRGGKCQIVTYDKGSDVTTIVWETAENAAQNAAGELRPDHVYRLLWGSFTAQAVNDTEALMARLTVPGFNGVSYNPIIIPGSGGLYNPKGARRIMFLTDSVMMKGDSVHRVEMHVGTTCRPLVHLCWEDFGPVK